MLTPENTCWGEGHPSHLRFCSLSSCGGSQVVGRQALVKPDGENKVKLSTVFCHWVQWVEQ